MSDIKDIAVHALVPTFFGIATLLMTLNPEYALAIFILGFALKGAAFIGLIPFVGVFKAHEVIGIVIDIAVENTVIQEGSITAVMHIVFTVSAAIATILTSIIVPILIIGLFLLGVATLLED